MAEPVKVADLPEELRPALRRLIIALADTKRILGLRYSDWLLGAPSIETGIAASSMSQDEWGHARLLYAMLKEFGESPSDAEHVRPAEEYGNAPALDEAFSDWAGFVAAMVVVDGALTTALQGFAEGRFDFARTRVPKMLAEEEFHRDMGLAWLKKLVNANEEARGRIREAVRFAIPSTLAWMAPEDEAFQSLVDAGLTAPRDVLLKRFEETYGDALRAAGADSMEPDFSDWDGARGRASGAPAEEVVERASGDRNRALLVE